VSQSRRLCSPPCFHRKHQLSDPAHRDVDGRPADSQICQPQGVIYIAIISPAHITLPCQISAHNCTFELSGKFLFFKDYLAILPFNLYILQLVWVYH